MTTRSEFTNKTKKSAFERCGGLCELCGWTIHNAEYDHYPVPAALGGSNDLSNCRCLCRKCHRRITAEKDVPSIARTRRIREKRAGLRRSRRPFPKHIDPWGKGRNA
jgi:5-methylcytosine-specific restriction endonuclease McrA